LFQRIQRRHSTIIKQVLQKLTFDLTKKAEELNQGLLRDLEVTALYLDDPDTIIELVSTKLES
jgi:hypothetical protein